MQNTGGLDISFNFSFPVELTTDEMDKAVSAIQGQCRKVTLFGSGHFYNPEINAMAHSILEHIGKMKLQNRPSAEIFSYAHSSLNQLQNAKISFDGTRTAFQKNCEDFTNKCNSLEEKIKTTSLPSLASLMKQNSSPQSFSMPPFPIPRRAGERNDKGRNQRDQVISEELRKFNEVNNQIKPQKALAAQKTKSAEEVMNGNPLNPHLADRREVTLGTAYLSEGLRYLTYPFEKAFEKTIQGVFDINDHYERQHKLQENCDLKNLRNQHKNVDEFGRAIINCITKNSIIEKKPVEVQHHALADELKRQYHIPRDQGIRFEENGIALLPFFILPIPLRVLSLPFLPAATTIIKNKTFSTFTRFLLEDSGALKIPPVNKAMTGKEMVKLYKEAGWKEVKGEGKGSHRKLIKEGYEDRIIPHGTLATGTKGMLRKKLIESADPPITGIVPSARAFIKKVGAMKTKDAADSIFDLLTKAQDPIGKFVPVIEDKLSNEAIWVKEINANRTHPLKDHKIEYFIEGKSNVAKITDESISLVVKESFQQVITSEVMGIYKLKSLGLKFTRIPDIHAFGKHNINPNGKHARFMDLYFFAKSYLPGKTYSELCAETIKDINQLCDVAYGAGRALGELQTKGQKKIVSEELITTSKKTVLSELNRKLLHLSDSFQKIKSPGLQEKINGVIAKFETDPGPLTLAFNDVHGEQFIWNPLHEIPFSYIDLEQFAQTMTVSGMPLKFAREEYVQFLKCFEHEGVRHAFTESEVSHIKHFFVKGYEAEFKGPQSEAAKEFFELYSDISQLYRLEREIFAVGYKGGDNATALSRLNSGFDKKLHDFYKKNIAEIHSK